MIKNICITGAAGNLGSLTARHLLEYTDCHLNLMIHKSQLPDDLANSDRVTTYKCELNNKESLKECLENSDQIVHYAGILFKANPEEFLPKTNIEYFRNLIDVAKEVKVKRVILISFPHVEGYTDTNYPSTNKTDQLPISMHAKTRLEEERLLLSTFDNGVVLRVGMVYGDGILMPDGARWLAKKWLLGVWKEPTLIHLILKFDFAEVVKNTLLNENASGTYNIGDDGVQTLQEYLFFACEQWKCKKPWRMPLWMIYFAASALELFSAVFGTKSPLTNDFIDIGRVSYYGDTKRMRDELLGELRYSTMVDGKDTF